MIDPRQAFPRLFRPYIPPDGGLRMTFELGTDFGAFHCFSLRDRPPEPHLLWPEFYFLWGYGPVTFVREPRPTDTEQILEVGVAPLADMCARLALTPGAGGLLVDIYRLADRLRRDNL